MDSAVVFSSPQQPLQFGSTIQLEGAVWQHDMRANMTNVYVSVNPSFHARDAQGYDVDWCQTSSRHSVIGHALFPGGQHHYSGPRRNS